MADDAIIKSSNRKDVAFLKRTQDILGDRAVIHLASILPQDVRNQVIESCDKFICMNGAHFSVPNRKEYVYRLRTAARAEGVITTFFEWTGFRLVFFVDTRKFRWSAIKGVLSGEDFVREFGKFSFETAVEYKV